MPFREKSAWISLLSTLGVYGLYFASVGRPGQPPGTLAIGSLLGTIVALVVIQAVLMIGVALLAPRDAKAPRDERERLIDLRAAHFAYSGLATAVACACFFGALNPPIVFGVNSLLFILVTAEVMRFAFQIFQYRRGA